jgi:DNA polymerase III alpha subunit
MNNEVKLILYNRAKLIQNMDRIVNSTKKSNSAFGQLSLFEEEHVDIEIALQEPENFNALEMALAEGEVLGYNLLYSQFDEYFDIQCRYCSGTISNLLSIASKEKLTVLAEIRDIEYNISQYGNKYAKIRFADHSGQEVIYLFGRLYERMISKCFIGKIYLLTVTQSEDKKVDIINFMPANDIKNISDSCKTLHVTITSEHLPELRLYLKSYMMGNNQSVIVHVSDLGVEIPLPYRVKIDNENLLEMSKKGFSIKLR